MNLTTDKRLPPVLREHGWYLAPIIHFSTKPYLRRTEMDYY